MKATWQSAGLLAVVAAGLGFGISRWLLPEPPPPKEKVVIKEVLVEGPTIVKEVPVQLPVDAQAPSRETDVRQRLDGSEARQAALSLAEENEKLRKRLQALEAQVHDLNTALVDERVAADQLRVETGRNALPTSDAPLMQGLVSAKVWVVLERDAETGLVAVNAGEAQGVVPQMRLDVLREDERIARLRVVEVRDRISGAVVEEKFSESFPSEGDRVTITAGT